MKKWMCSTVIVPLLLLFYSVKNATSILCYDCNSAFDPRCGEEFDPFSLGVINCSLRDPPDHLGNVEASFCRSIKMDIFSKKRVVRSCGYLADNDTKATNATCRRVSGIGDVFVTHCTCDTDLCNAAVASKCTKMALLSILATVLVVF